LISSFRRHSLKVFDPARHNRGTDELVLSLEALCQNRFIQVCVIYVVWRAFARKNGPTVIDEGQNHRNRRPFVLRLDVVNHTVEFYICVVTGDHKLKRLGTMGAANLGNLPLLKLAQKTVSGQ